MNTTLNELKKLESTGKYLFHGSSNGDIKILEPRQAMSSGKPDGRPCIAATASIEPAIFMAVLGSKHVGGWGKGPIKRGQFGFFIRRGDFQRAEKEFWRGYVYVLDRTYFHHQGAWEWRAFRAVKPVQLFNVNTDDLPKMISLEN